VTDSDVSNGEYYSFILSNMPTNCDYGLLVVNDNLEGVKRIIRKNYEKLEYVKFHNDVRFCKKLAK